MQLLKVSNLLLDASKSFLTWLYTKFKTLLFYILKHPLGSLFWLVKAYLALMFLSIFVACSFGAFAAVVDDLDTKPAKQTKLVKCRGSYAPKAINIDGAGLTFLECATNVRQTLSGHLSLPPAHQEVQNGAATIIVDRSFAPLNCTESSCDAGYKVTETTSTRTCTGVNGVPFCETGKPSTSSFFISAPINLTLKEDGYICPPDGFPDYTQLIKEKNLCHKPLPREQPCWKSDGAWRGTPPIYITDSQKDNICAFNDEGLNCPWKKVSRGIYEPDPRSPLNCDNEKPEPPPPPVDCKVAGDGSKICKADPNERCSTVTEPNKVPVTSCDEKCGYLNGEFVCFARPNDPIEDPNTPDKDPLKNPDDNITDPSKKMSDMLKSDLKDIFGGAEDRLDNLLTSSENSQKGNEGLLRSLTNAQREGNKKLGGIEENTKGIEEGVKKISDALSGELQTEGGDKPDFEETKNDWKERNFGTILKAKGDELMALPLFKSIDNFFDVSFGGTCPTYSVSVWVFDLSVDQFCGPTMANIWPYIRAVCLLLCSFLAIRIALL